MKNLVKDASMGPLREALRQGIEITKLKKEDMRPVTFQVKSYRLTLLAEPPCYFSCIILFWFCFIGF